MSTPTTISGSAVANSLAAVDEGATYVDGCCAGLGAGAGNAPLEIIAAVFSREGIDVGGVDWFKIVDATEKAVRPIMPRPQLIDGPALTLGYAGVYSSFLLHAERAATRFNVDPREILLECGRRKLVGGQEDTMMEIAVQLSREKRGNGNLLTAQPPAGLRVGHTMEFAAGTTTPTNSR